jgi:hypothetical protein
MDRHHMSYISYYYHRICVPYSTILSFSFFHFYFIFVIHSAGAKFLTMLVKEALGLFPTPQVSLFTTQPDYYTL